MGIHARGFQKTAPLDQETLQQGADLYDRAVAGDPEAARQLSEMAVASERGDEPVILEQVDQPGIIQRLLGRLGLRKSVDGQE